MDRKTHSPLCAGSAPSVKHPPLGCNMTYYAHILIAIDDFHSAKRLLEFAAALAAGNERFRIHLFHAISPLPPQLLESRGAEDAVEEQIVEKDQEAQQDGWITEQRRTSRAELGRVKAALAAQDIAAENIRIHLCLLTHENDLGRQLLKTARANHCRTVVIGRASYPWFGELFRTHIDEQIISHSEELAICVVNEHPSVS
jgi:nucleotide-binding universal stress UspA family protein